MTELTENNINKLFLHKNNKKHILELMIPLIIYRSESNMWNHKIIQLTIALISVLDEKRAKNEIIINSDSIAFYLDLKNLISLYKDNQDLLSVREELHAYLIRLPQLNMEENIISEIALEQHQYLVEEINTTLKIIQHIEKMK